MQTLGNQMMLCYNKGNQKASLRGASNTAKALTTRRKVVSSVMATHYCTPTDSSNQFLNFNFPTDRPKAPSRVFVCLSANSFYKEVQK